MNSAKASAVKETGAARPALIKGRGVSRGLVAGVSCLLRRESAASVIERYRAGHVPGCDQDITFDALLEKTIAQADASHKMIGARLPEAATLLFDSHLTMLQDPMFHDRVKDEIANGAPLPKAIAEAAVAFVRLFRSSQHELMREKAADIEDVTLHLLGNLSSGTGVHPECPDGAPCIVIARELLPSDIVRIAQRNARAIVLTTGGLTAHVSLLVRSLGIPMVIANAPELLDVKDGTPMIVDGADGTVRISPTPAAVRAYERRMEREAASTEKKAGAPAATATRDGVPVSLLANINLISEVSAAISGNADGIGLYRTELLYLMRKDLPGETEQENVYRSMLERMSGRPVIFRTLDAGGDKMLPYLGGIRESNPALGLRSTRFTLRHSEIFDAQMRAIIRAAGTRRDVGVLFPMIGSIEEWRAARARFDACATQVAAQTGKKNRIMLGMMVELPAVADIAAELAAEADFFSIGTNDFIQYMLAVDRTNESVASYYCPHHPAVLRGLKRVMDGVAKAGIPVSVCGEMARDPRYIPFLVGIGVRSLSVDPSYIPSTRESVGSFTVAQAEEYAASLLAEATVAGIESKLGRFQKIQQRKARL